MLPILQQRTTCTIRAHLMRRHSTVRQILYRLKQQFGNRRVLKAKLLNGLETILRALLSRRNNIARKALSLIQT
jgi:hypothetical protein